MKLTKCDQAYNNPGSALSPEESQHFASRFSDPNHPVNSGSLLALVTGGMYDARARRQEKWDRRAERREWRNERRIARGRPPRHYRHQRLPRGQREPKGIRRLLTQNVLYLTVVNLPTDEEIAAARVKLSQAEKQHGMMGLRQA